METLTEIEREILIQLRLRPNGVMIRDGDLKPVVIGLCNRRLVCDPHQMGSALFTRITDEGKAALDASAEFDPADHPDAGGPAGR